MVDLLRENFIPMSDHDIQLCLITNNNLYFCPQLQPIHNNNSTTNNCEMSILRTAQINANCHLEPCTDQQYWKPLHTPNTWLVSVISNEPINTVCENHPKQMEITGSGILKIDKGCLVRTSTVVMEGHKDITNARQVVYIPACNISQVQITPEQSQHHLSRTTYNLNADIDALQKELHNVKGISLTKIRPHDVHHYGLGYTMLLFVLCCVTCIVWLHCKQRHLTNSTQPIPAPRHQNSSIPAAADSESNIIRLFHR